MLNTTHSIKIIPIATCQNYNAEICLNKWMMYISKGRTSLKLKKKFIVLRIFTDHASQSFDERIEQLWERLKKNEAP